MSSDNFSHDILAGITILFQVFSIIWWLKMFQEANKYLLYSTQNLTYRYNREDTMTKIIATHIGNMRHSLAYSWAYRQDI